MRSSLSLLVLLIGAAPAFAHKLYVDPTIFGDRLRVEVYYDDDAPAQDAKVTVFFGDEQLATGMTDEKGVWTCQAPGPGTYLVRAESLGHAAKETVVVPDPAAEPLPPAPESRANRTRTPWRNIALGLGLIGGAILVGRVLRRTPAAPVSPAQS
jgi:nickel transport protein